MTVIPTDSEERKNIPMATGLLDYFPGALAEVAKLSKVGNDQHNPGQPLHWARGKSSDHADTIIRHLADRGTIDVDGVRHAAKVAWRALALLQQELEDAGALAGRASRFPATGAPMPRVTNTDRPVGQVRRHEGWDVRDERKLYEDGHI